MTTPVSTVIDISARGALAESNSGRHGHLLAFLPAESEEPILLGEARATMPPEISPVRIREQIAEGEIPDEFQDIVLPVLTSDGGLFGVVQSEGVAERHSRDGALVWSRQLLVPEVDAAIDRFFRGWEEGVDWPRSFPVPTTARWGRELGEDLWLMMDSVDEAGSTLVVIDGASGDPIRRVGIELEGRGGPFAVDLARNTVYLVVRDSPPAGPPKSWAPRWSPSRSTRFLRVSCRWSTASNPAGGRCGEPSRSGGWAVAKGIRSTGRRPDSGSAILRWIPWALGSTSSTRAAAGRFACSRSRGKWSR